MTPGAPANPGARPNQHPPRQAPQVTREWPADEPEDPVNWPIVIALAGALLVASAFIILSSLLDSHPHLPTGPAIASLAALMLLAGVLEQAVERRLPPAARALRSARRAVLLGEEAHVTAARVRGVELAGRAGRCRDAAMRCLVEAGKCRRLEERLRREAVRWLGRALDELFKDVR